MATAEWLQAEWKTNHHLYDLYDHNVHDRVKPFFDFDCEFVEIKDPEQDGLCWSFAKKSNSKLKYSAHVYVNQGVAIALKDIRAFKASIAAAHRPELKDQPDVSPYAKAYPMKLPYQTKVGDPPSRALVPKTCRSRSKHS